MLLKGNYTKYLEAVEYELLPLPYDPSAALADALADLFQRGGIVGPDLDAVVKMGVDAQCFARAAADGVVVDMSKVGGLWHQLRFCFANSITPNSSSSGIW